MLPHGKRNDTGAAGKTSTSSSSQTNSSDTSSPLAFITPEAAVLKDDASHFKQTPGDCLISAGVGSLSPYVVNDSDNGT